MNQFNVTKINGNGNSVGDNNNIINKGSNEFESPSPSDEDIIRKEARAFFKTKLEQDEIGKRTHAIDKFKLLKTRLFDFYSFISKAVFLDEVQANISRTLTSHHKKAHGGVPKPDCLIEIEFEKLLFYIRQEISTFPKIVHLNSNSTSVYVRKKVFVSYSHLDGSYLADIKRHFKPFLSEIDFWDDSKIFPGSKWKEEIALAINNTKVAILLVSADFLGSDFIQSNELPQLLDAAENDGAAILTVILKPVLFEEFPKLNKFQAMNDPSKPVSKMNDNEKEDLFVNLVRQTKRLLSTSEN
ncbi:MAG TPA: toll/interleukin-1 receptor domain-containing protein [Saprospiraceae bacterium]|nr:toll/interleukin-1 receptor domain-containing protein [Saprospiraceae bacterium]